MLEYTGLLSTIGNTPIIELKKLFSSNEFNFNVYAKLESQNPSGSTKDRSALCMITDALNSGKINKDTTIVESSSGNFGIALAQICLILHLKFICVIDPKTTSQNIDLLKAYGAQLEYVEKPDMLTGEYLPARIERVNQLLSKIPNSYNLNQYRNLCNPFAHRSTAKEIINSFNGCLDYIFCTVSTCGTIRGYSEYIKEHNYSCKLVAVDAIGSIIFGSTIKKRLIPGHGAAIKSPLFQEGLVDDFLQVSDFDCVYGCHKLLYSEGVFAGGSTGAIVSAIMKYKDTIPAGSNCVMIVHDRGDRYLDSIYSNEWINTHFKGYQL